MTHAMRAEARKLLTHRSAMALGAVCLVYVVLAFGMAMTASPDARDLTPATMHTGVRAPATFFAFAMLMVGVLATAGEVRHGTIVPSLLAVPRRGRFVAAKLAVVCAYAAGVAATVSAVGLALATALLRDEGIAATPLAAKPLVTAGAVVAVVVAYAAMGVGLSLLLRDQTAAITAALVWSLVVEGVLPSLLRSPGLERWLPMSAARSVLAVAQPDAALLPPAGAAALLATIVAVVVGGGAVIFQRRDID